jgi:NADH-quinone oxidoreductase subunit E
VTMMLSEHTRQEIQALPTRFPQPRSAVVPALDLAQEELSWLPPAAMAEIADLLGLDPGYVEGVASFYPLFHLQPTGRHHFYVCTNLSCALRGAGKILAHLRLRTGVEPPAETSPDRLFSVNEAECLGACEYAPMLRYVPPPSGGEGSFHYDLSLEKVDLLVQAVEKGGL